MQFSRLLKYGIGIAVIGGISYYGYTRFFASTPMTTRPSIVRVGTGNISNTLKTTGNITPVQQSTLTFTKQGTVSKIHKSIGESVKKGDILAEIDAKSAYLDLESARISLSNANISYQNTLNTSELEALQLENTIEENESSMKLQEKEYENLLTEQKNTLLENEENIKLLESKYDLAKSELEYAEKNITTDTTSNNLEKDLTSAMIALEDTNRSLSEIQEDFYDIMLLADRANSRYGDLGANNESNKKFAENLFTTWSGSIQEFNSTMILLRASGATDFTATLRALEDAKSLLNDGSRLASSIIIEIDSSIRGNFYTTSLVDIQTATVKGHASTLGTKLSSINSTLTTLKNYGNNELEALADKNTIATKKQIVEDTKNTLAKAKRTLEGLRTSQESTRSSKQDEITKMKNTQEINKKKYADMQNGSLLEDKKSAENSIRSAQISLERAGLTLKDYQIIASFDGVIEDIPWRVGDMTESSEGIVISNKDLYEISLSLDQIDIVKIKPGMNARIVLDAFPTEIFTGTVASVSQTPIETSGVVSYTAYIQLTISDREIMSKMSATVTIIITEKNNVLVIPVTATKTENKKTYVTVRIGMGPNGTTEKREILLGTSESGKVEVLSGVTLGELIEGGTTVSSGSIQTRSSSSTNAATRRATGGFGGPPGGF